MSWHLTYIRTSGRGFSLDDPDTIAYLCTTIVSIIYLVYNIQINVDPEDYGSNYLYVNGDILYLVTACFCIFATLRDDYWFWFLPMSGQYAVAPGKISIETEKVLPSYGKPSILIRELCRRRRVETKREQAQQDQSNRHNFVIITFH